MPLHIPDGFAEINVRWSLSGDPEVMTVAYGVETSAVTPADVQDLVDDHYAEWATFMANWSSDYSLVGLSCKAHIGASFFEAENLLVTGGGGGAVAVPVQNTALLVRKSTGLAGRANRGRWYLPAGRLAEVDVNNTGIIDSADVTVIQGEITTLTTGLASTPFGGALVLLHTETAPGVGPDATPITLFTLDNRVASQRRRLR